MIDTTLEGAGKKLKEFKVKHNVHLQKSDGNYQIDIYAEFEEWGVIFKILIERIKVLW